MSAETANEARFTVRVHLGFGPWKWSVWDAKTHEAVALHVERSDAQRTAKQLNAEGFVDA